MAEEALNLLLSAAQSAPAKSNLQRYSIIMVRDSMPRDRIAGLAPSMPWMKTAPLIAVFWGDVRRIRRLAEMAATHTKTTTPIRS